MATILLQAAGAALGGVFGPIGAVVGRAAGALAGSAVDRALIGGRTVSGPRLEGGRIPTAQEGAGITRLYGTARIAGNLIWATHFEEETTSERQGGKGGGGTIESYAYFANFAVGLCEGVISGVRRIWADGRELDQSGYEIRVYRGTGDQLPDPLIEAKQGAGRAPAYRGLAYVVFERLPLDGFGNRIPVLHFEVTRPVGQLERDLRAITIIPGATEHGYSPAPVSETIGPGESRVMNRHVVYAPSDWTAAVDELQALCPNLQTVALVATWFGTDLRAEHCKLVPGVEVAERIDETVPWSVSGLTRASAYLISRRNDTPSFGGTPDDRSVLAAIADLKERGLKVFLYPFVMMDIAEGNGLPDPEGGAEQPVYPWRGRITCHPAIGQPATADRSAAARAQVEAFCGDEFGYRRFILHYAQLAAAAGGVDGFGLGSEMRGLTRVRDETGRFPFVEQLVTLAGEVRAILGEVSGLTYAADWSEYFGYYPADGSGDVFYNLDPLWMSEAVSAVGIDNYMPLADWRDGDLATGNPDGFATPTDRAAMRGQIAAGEGYDWFYASEEDRTARRRTPITDGAAGKPWVFRFKDMENWWGNAHHERIGGIEQAAPTVWQPRAKPIWFTEIGCPAIDKGANQPNVFPDAKSSESQVPYFSTGARSDLTQRRFLEAHLGYWASEAAPAGMVDPARIFAWTWDSRPYPAFPNNRTIWSDGENWTLGHWLSGRLGALSAADLIAAVLADHGFRDFVVEDLGGDLVGYVVSEPTSARATLEPVLALMQADATESGGTILFRSRTRRTMVPLALGAVADLDGEPLVEEVRLQVSELASEALLDHFDPITDYEPATVRSRRLEAGSRRQERLALPASMAEQAAGSEIDLWLRDHWSGRGRIRFALPASMIALESGDAVHLDEAAPGEVFVISRIEDGLERRVEARAITGGTAAGEGASARTVTGAAAGALGWTPIVHLIDLPVLEGDDETIWARGAAYSRPWRRMALTVAPGEDGFAQRAALTAPARIGVLIEPLGGGVAGRFDDARTITAQLPFGRLESRDDQAVFNGANALAIRSNAGNWEVVQFAHAEEIAAGTWRLSRLLRGQAGTEDAMAAGAAAGADVVMLDEAVRPLGLKRGEADLPLNWRARSNAGTIALASGFAAGRRALTPLSPVHLRAVRLESGDIRLTWVRRGRFDADQWLAPEIPLDAPEERYRVEILDGETVLQTFDVEAAQHLYTAGEEIADFGDRQEAITVRVRQFGGRVALGIPATRMLAV